MSYQGRTEYENSLAHNRFQNLLVVNGLWVLGFVTLATQDLKAPFLCDHKQTILYLMAVAATVSTMLSIAAMTYGLKRLDNIKKESNKKGSKFKRSTTDKCVARVLVRSHLFVTPLLLIILWIYLGGAVYPTETPVVGWLGVVAGLLSLIVVITGLLWPRAKVGISPPMDADGR